MSDAIENLIQAAPPASHTKFPVVWSEAYRSSLRQVADGERQGYSPIDAQVYHALLLCAEGDFDTAEELLLALLRDNLELLQKNGESFISLLFSFFAVQRTDIVAALLAQRFAFADPLEIAFEECGIGIGIMRWDISTKREHRFVYDASVLRSDATRLEILNLFWEFPLIANYAAQPEIEHGSVTLCRNDIASRPGLGYCGASPEIFLIPDGGFVPSKGYDWSRQVLAKNRLRWEDRRPVAFWRGATTGMKRSDRDWRGLERVRLCEIARRYKHTGLFDVGLSNVTQVSDPVVIKEINDSGLVLGRVPWQDWGRYRYQIDIDGNSSPYSNLIQRLLTGSPVLKVDSSRGLMQWFYSELIPWHNYVPISSDMSDLVDKVQWLTRNDEFAQTVGRNGLEMIERMTLERELRRSVPVISSAFRYFRDESAYVLPNGMPPHPTGPAAPSRGSEQPSVVVADMPKQVASAPPQPLTELIADGPRTMSVSHDPFTRKKEIEVEFRKGPNPELQREYLALLTEINRQYCGLVDFQWPDVPAPLYMRCGSSDLANFGQMFVHQEYGFPISFVPRRILDLGAYAGYASAFLAARFPHAEIVSVEPSPANFQMLTMNTSAYRRIRRLNVAVWGHRSTLDVASTRGGDWGIQLIEADNPKEGRPALSIPEILEHVGWDRFDFLKCDIEGAEASVFAETGALIANMIQCCAVETHDALVPGVTDMICRTLDGERFQHSRHGEFHVFARTVLSELSGGAPRASLLRPERGVRAISLTNVRPEGWAYSMFDGDSCQLHPATRGQPLPELTTVVDLAGETEFCSELQAVSPFGFGVDFLVLVQDESDGSMVAEAVRSVGANERLDWVVPLHHTASGPHRVTLRTVMTEAGKSSHQVCANWISPHFR